MVVSKNPTLGTSLFSSYDPQKSPSQPLPRLYLEGPFLWRRIEELIGVAAFMHRTAIFINFALVQVDWLETNGTEEGTLSAHKSTSRIMANIHPNPAVLKQKMRTVFFICPKGASTHR
jgi:hypothetical protein